MAQLNIPLSPFKCFLNIYIYTCIHIKSQPVSTSDGPPADDGIVSNPQNVRFGKNTPSQHSRLSSEALKCCNGAKSASQTAHNSLPHLTRCFLMCANGAIVSAQAELQQQQQLPEQKTRRSLSGAAGTQLHLGSTIVSERRKGPSAALKKRRRTGN